MHRLDYIYSILLEMYREKNSGISANEISKAYDMDRANVSRYLNKLFKLGKVSRIEGRPVLYKVENSEMVIQDSNKNVGNRETLNNKSTKERSYELEKLVGYDSSLQVAIQQAKAAILYPSGGLHILLLGETGVGKSMFAESIYEFSKETNALESDAPFIRFNCADYADNPQLVMAQIFGVKKGAYTGANEDKEGLLKKADNGIFFLDEIHRLSHQGQEMLFTYIDKGIFRRLGETEVIERVNVRIIAATTEDPNSYLLKTFSRRIQMTIQMPSLKERGLKERFTLIENFIRQESKRVGKSIYVNRNSLVSYLLYDCINNIGQLKSDIQLACAKAFLNYKTHNESYILIQQSDIPGHVKKGLMKLQIHRKDIDKMLFQKGDIQRFNHKDQMSQIVDNKKKEETYFYSHIENRLEELKSDGFDEQEVNQIINIDIESHFQNYLGRIPEQFRKEEILKIVDSDIVDVVEAILKFASEKLNKTYNEKVLYGLALHLHGSLERLRKGKRIFHPKLNLIRVNYADAFMTAMEAAKLIDNAFGIEVPLDEIGYLAMFLVSDAFDYEAAEDDKVGVLVIMHGSSTATSMVQVANNLVGTECTLALDMPLSMHPEEMYKRVVKEAQLLNQGKGILFLVDMGSLTNFSDMLFEDLGIPTRSINMVSTPIVIEASRKAELGRDLKEIYNDCRELVGFSKPVVRKKNKKLRNLIVTVCFTGEGASERLKTIIKDSVEQSDQIEIRSLNILNRGEFLASLENYKESYNLLAVVGTIDVELEDTPFISAVDLLSGKGMDELKEHINRELIYESIAESLNEHLNHTKGAIVVHDVRKAMAEIDRKLRARITEDVKKGILLHMCFMVDKLVGGGEETEFKGLEEYLESFSRELELTKLALQVLENDYSIIVSKNECAYLTKMFLENNQV